MRPLALLAVLASVPALAQTADAPDDPHRWLEEVEGDEALAWVEARNAATLEALRAGPDFAPLHARYVELLTSDDRIAYPSFQGDAVVNLWTDDANPRGLWRRAPLDAYVAGAPGWETLLDVDALAEAEGVPWSFGGATCLAPDYERCLVRLSRGGADAVELREFDLAAKAFVDGGFAVPEAKMSAAWVDADAVLLTAALDPGETTDSGYPRVARLWRRGTALADAEVVYAGEARDVGVWAGSVQIEGERVPAVFRTPAFFQSERRLLLDGEAVRLDLPLDATPAFVADRLALYLRSDWEVGGATYPAGALLGIGREAFLAGDRAFEPLFVPSATQTVEDVSTTAGTVLVTILDDVAGRLLRFVPDGDGWAQDEVALPGAGDVDVVATSDEHDRFFYAYDSFVQPTTLYLAGPDGGSREVASLPAQFDADGLVVEQHRATSADGTEVPYFVVRPAGRALDGTAPTLLYGYGGFEISQTPSYNATVGAGWLERGGVYVVANIRGGGEYGPAWHRAAQRENRQRAFDDFIAVAEDLIDRGVTSPGHLGIRGGSNGGLLVGAVMTQRPELFGAAVVAVPLLDMRRYHTLLAGASWMAEYGDPDDPADWAFLREYSPYHNVDPEATYPEPLFTTTTRDDRVHPGHARKMAARMEAQGHPVRYFENVEGGHGGGVTPEQQATSLAVTYGYLWGRLR